MSIRSEIASILGTAPDALVSYFERGHFRNKAESRVYCLPFHEAMDYTKRLYQLPEDSRYTITANHFGLFALHDANDSNPHCFVSRGACAGAVMRLDHDGPDRISHRSLDSFIKALDSVIEDLDKTPIDKKFSEEILSSQLYAFLKEVPSYTDIDDMPCDTDFEFDTIPTIQNLLKHGQDADVLVPIYLRVTKELIDDLKQSLARSDNLFIREGLAEWLCEFGSSLDLPLAKLLSSDGYDQVARLARTAAQRLRI